MELDDLKQDWNKSTYSHQAPAYNLDQLTSTKRVGSLNILKHKYKKQVVLLPLAATFLGLFMAQNPILQHNAFIWFIIPILLLLALMYYRDYKLVLEMEQTSTESIKNSIQKNLDLLNRNTKQQLYFTRIILVLFLLLLEVTMYVQHPVAFDFWQTVALPLRLVLYGLMFYIQPFLTKYFFNLNFGRYIQDLQVLLNQAA